ncbi:MAG TPA: GAF domain-containing protein, partial [Kofleriaceae bacterium]|nr:GAF domain-containing protein [Kofleriaceae bacterium]
MKGTKAVLPPDVELEHKRTAEVPAAREDSLVELAQRSGERAERLLAIMSALAQLLTPREVAEVIAREIPKALGAAAGLVVAVTADRTHFELLSSFGIAAADRERFGRMPIDAQLPIRTAMAERRIIAFDDGAQLAAQYPLLRGTSAHAGGVFVAIPLFTGDGTASGGFAFQLHAGRQMEDDDWVVARSLANQCAQGLERSRLLEAEKRARVLVEQSAERTRRLQSVIARLSGALTAHEVADAILDASATSVGAHTAAIYLVAPSGDHLSMLGSRNYPAGDYYRKIPLDPSSISGDAVARRQPIWVETREEFAARYPVSEARSRGRTSHEGTPLAIACLPLVIEERCFGVVALSFLDNHRFEADERAFLSAIAQHCSQGLERARLYDVERAARREAEAARERSSFLADASLILSSSLDYEEMLPRIAGLAVPAASDLFAVELIDESGGALELAAVAHVDREMNDRIVELRRRIPLRLDDPGVAAVVARTGEASLFASIPEPLIVGAAQDAQHLALMREMQMRSLVAVPVSARGQIFGTLLLASRQDHRYGTADLEMVSQLGLRIGMAIDNTRLYRQAVQAVNIRDEFLSIAGHELRTPLTPILLESQVLSRLAQVPDIDKVRVRADKLWRNAERMGKLIDELLDVSRISDGRLRLVLQECDLREVVEDVIARASDEAVRAETEIRLELGEAARGLWDRTRVEQVTSNLVGNALKYGKGQPIDVFAGARDGRALLVVRDRGIGIAPEDQQRIFQRF